MDDDTTSLEVGEQSGEEEGEISVDEGVEDRLWTVPQLQLALLHMGMVNVAEQQLRAQAQHELQAALERLAKLQGHALMTLS